MHERCPVCRLKFEREEGYFLGAMYISYALALLTILIFGAIAWAATDWPLQTLVVAAILAFLPTAPWLTTFSRVLWIYFDQTVDPDRS